MSRLDELIAELCPDGVDYKPLLSVTNVLYGFPCDASLFNTDGVGTPLARIRDVNSGFSETFTTESIPQKYILSSGDLLIGMDGNFHVSSWKQEGAVLCQRVCKVFSKDETLLLNGFLAHLMKPIILKIENNKQSGTVKHLLDKDIKAIIIPVPPLPVQHEIVRILDNFTELTAELTAELTSELTARKKQYEYYRDFVINRYSDDISWMPLAHVANLFRGKYITQKDTVTGNIPVILGGQEPAYYINEANHEGEIVVVARSGASAGFVSYWNEPIFVTDGFGFEAKSELSISKYLYYALKNIEPDLNAMKRGAGVPHVNGDLLGKVMLPIPSLEEQYRIVSILDRFDILCNNISNGLPAEIAARQKQYEYYRDKLLSFKPLS